jgi:vancomycin permeability regulator SanA
MKAFKKIIYVISVFMALMPMALVIDIYTYPREELRESADAAIVLGAAIRATEPSPVFRERLNHALNLYKTGRIKKSF